MSKKILFHLASISERGGTLATLLLAQANKTILNNESYFACPINEVHEAELLNRIIDQIGESNILLYSGTEELDRFIIHRDISWIYYQIHGQHENLPSTACSTFVHAIFTTKFQFGTKYIPISDWLNRHNRTNYPVLPLIVPKIYGISDNLRNALGIPDTSTVFGGMGGKNSFNIPFIHSAVKHVAANNPEIHFVFLNFEKFCDLDNVHFLPKNTDVIYKEMFINTCDAMIHARGDGETFGMACAEFSIKGKPVITWNPGPLYYCIFSAFYILRRIGLTSLLPKVLWGIRPQDSYAKAHLDSLGEKAILYRTKQDAINIMTNLKKYTVHQDYDCYSVKFSDQAVAERFRKILDDEDI